jgi:preprotein translocase subunit SecA
LVGTITIDRSEALADMLKRKGIPHQVLNAKFHEMEAQIVAQAGRYQGVTIATNMAGRGTDILLGGNADFMAKSVIKQKLVAGEESDQEDYKKFLEKYKRETEEEHRKVVALGGLHVLGTERHEARRIDNQLRGRCGRQGDPGSSRFYVSFEDELMRMFAPDWILKMLEGVDTGGEPLTLKEGNMAHMISKSIETAQRRVEQHNFEIRKQLLEYDNVMSKQREVIYSQRRQILEGVVLKDEILSMVERIVAETVAVSAKEDTASFTEADSREISAAIKAKFGVETDPEVIKGSNKSAAQEILTKSLVNYYEGKEKHIGPEMSRYFERMVFLQIVDSKWKDHLYSMDKLREGIGLRAYGHKDPLIEYKNEAFNYFNLMVSGIEEEALEMIFKLQPAKPERFRGVFSAHQEMVHPEAALPAARPDAQDLEAPVPGARSQAEPKVAPIKSDQPKVGRNDPCPCGSGKKYKKCCGK